MPNLQITEVGPNHSRLTVSISQNEVSNLYKKQLNRYQQNANLKGFRKGKAPMSYVQSLMGNDILIREVLNIFDTETDKFYKENRSKLFMPPMPIEGSVVVPSGIKDIKDCTCDFDVIYMPTLDMMNIPTGDIEILTLDMNEEEVTRVLTESLSSTKNWQDTNTVANPTSQEQRVFFEGVEVKDGEVAEDGFKAEFSIYNLDFTEAFLAQLENIEVGSTVRVDLREIEVDTDEKHVRSYYLGMDVEAETSFIFDLTVTKIQGASKYEINDETARALIGKEDATVEDMLLEVKTSNENDFHEEFQSLLYAQLLTHYRTPVLDALTDEAKQIIWKARTDEEKNASQEDYNIRISNSVVMINLLQALEVKVTNQDLLDAAIKNIEATFRGRFPHHLLESFAKDMLKKESSFYDRAFETAQTKAITLAAIEKLPIEKRTVVHTIEDFNANAKRIVETFGLGETLEEPAITIPTDEEVIAEEITTVAE